MNRLSAAMHPVSFCTSLRHAGGPNLHYGGNFLGIGFDPTLGDHESEMFAGRNPENTFFGVELDGISPEAREGLCQVRD
jgi:hypothetical protein